MACWYEKSHVVEGGKGRGVVDVVVEMRIQRRRD